MIENCLDIMHRHYMADWPIRLPEEINRIVIHRFRLPNHLPDAAVDAYEVADFFEREPKWVGPRMPYHFVICVDGRCQQALELDVIGSHARGKNRDGIGIAVIGDFRHHAPTLEQSRSLFELVTALDSWISPAIIERHRPVGDPVKDCPGRHLHVEGLKSRIEDLRVFRAPEDAERRLVDLGVVV